MNAGYDFLEIERHKLIVDRSKALIDMLWGEDLETVERIMKASKAKLDKYNAQNRTVVDITKTEQGIWMATVKKVVVGGFTNFFVDRRAISRPHVGGKCCDEYDGYCDECQKLDDEYYAKLEKSWEQNKVFTSACETTVFPDDLKLKYVLFSRGSNWAKLNPLQTALRDSIHTEILTIFQNQNQKLIATT